MKILFTCLLLIAVNCKGQTWYPLGSGLSGSDQFNDRVYALCGDSIHNIMWAGGSFQIAGGDSIANLAGWSGTHWIPLTVISGVDTVPKIFYRKITALILFENKLFIAEAKNSFFNNRSNVYVYDRDSLTCKAIASFNTDVSVFQIYNNELYAGGAFANSRDSTGLINHSTKCIAKWDGTYFQNVGVGLFGEVNALCTYNGNLLVSGHIVSSIGAGTSEHGIPAWNGVQWISVVNSFGASVDYNNIYISSMCEFNGKLFVGCSETFSELASDLMIWSGGNWTISSISYGPIFALKEFNHSIFIGGNSTICSCPWYNITFIDSNLNYHSTGKCPLFCGTNCISSLDYLGDYLFTGGQFHLIGDTSNLINAGFIARYDPTPVGISQSLTNENVFYIYPNPASETVTLEYRGTKAQIIIENCLGEKLKTLQLTGNEKQVLDISQFENGVYFLRVVDEHNQQFVKLIVQK